MSKKKIIISEPINTLSQFKQAMMKIKGLGFVKAHRKGPTSIGKTLEDLLGIEENCISTLIRHSGIKSHKNEYE